MAYAASGLSLLSDLIGGKQREWMYRTTDSIGTVDDTDYFTDASDRGVKEGDIIWVVKTDTPAVYFTYVSDVDSDGNATVTVATYVSGQATTFSVALAASGTTDGMDITITAKDEAGNTVAAVHAFEWWISEAATGIGLTADSYSGSVTASVGAIHTAVTAKKHFLAVTAATGIFTATAVDSANPTDQYVAVKKPFGGGVVVSTASGTNWEGV